MRNSKEMISKKGMAVKMMTLVILLVGMILYSEGKGNRLDARFMKTRTANLYKKVLSFSVTNCASFSITNVQPYTSCPFTTDSLTIVDYFCESNVAYVIATTKPAAFTAQIVGATPLGCNIGDYSDSCGFFHTLAKDDEVTCGTKYCDGTSFVTGCMNGDGTKAMRDNFVYFTATAPSDLSCKETGGSCCASLAPICTVAAAPCPNSVYGSLTQSGSRIFNSGSTKTVTYTFLKAATVTGYQFKSLSVAGNPSIQFAFKKNSNSPFHSATPTFVPNTDVPIPFIMPNSFVPGDVLTVTISCSNCNVGTIQGEISRFSGSATDPSGTITYTNSLFAYPTFVCA